MVRLAVAVLALAAFAPQAAPRDGKLPRYQTVFDQVTHDKGCKQGAKRERLVWYVCDKGLSVWYFTKPGTPEHPGYIRRSIVVKNGSTYMSTEAHFDGSDEQQPAFKAWMDSVGHSIANDGLN